jgi:hypothetical protein
VSDLRVLCICPYHRPEFIARARQCFEHQTYSAAEWWEWDTSKVKWTIGAIRNDMIRVWPRSFDLIAHFDHDDWSAPERLAEQVALIESSGKPATGYLDMPFYDEIRDRVSFYSTRDPHYALGTSLMYRRDLWERTPFPDAKDEDTAWCRKIGAANIARCSSLVDGEPRMVATIHRHNTSHKGGARYGKASAELDAAVRSCLSLPNVAQWGPSAERAKNMG